MSMNEIIVLAAVLVAFGVLVVLVSRLANAPRVNVGLIRPYLPVLYVQVQRVVALVMGEVRKRVKDTESKFDDEIAEELALLLQEAVDSVFAKLGYTPGVDA